MSLFYSAGLGNAIPDSGVFRWALNEGSGSTATDSFENNNTGTLKGNPTYGSNTVHERSHSLALDGSGDYIVDDENRSALFDGATEYSVSVWFYPTSASNTDDDGRILFAYSNGSNNRHVIKQANGLLRGVYYDGNFHGASTSFGNINSWNNAVLTFSPPTTAKLYLNGSEVSGSDLTGVSDTVNPARFGADDAGNDFVGNLDLIDVYNKELTASEVNSLYNTDSI